MDSVCVVVLVILLLLFFYSFSELSRNSVGEEYFRRIPLKG